jgi:hypothetical protein
MRCPAPTPRYFRRPPLANNLIARGTAALLLACVALPPLHPHATLGSLLSRAAFLFLCGDNASAMNISRANSSGVAAQRQNGVWLLGNWGRGDLQGRAVEGRCERRPVAPGTGSACSTGRQRGESRRRERWEEEDKVRDWVPRARNWYLVNLFA